MARHLRGNLCGMSLTRVNLFGCTTSTKGQDTTPYVMLIKKKIAKNKYQTLISRFRWDVLSLNPAAYQPTVTLYLCACRFIILFEINKTSIDNETDNSFSTKGTGCACIIGYVYVYILSFSYTNKLSL